VINVTRISIVGIVGLPPNYGGFETFADQVVKRLQGKFHFNVYCSSSSYKEKQKEYFGATLKYLPLKANGWQSTLYDGIAMLDAVFHSDVVFLLGVSGAVFMPLTRWLCNLLGKKLIVHMDGLEWKRAKWGRIARSFLRHSEALAVKYAHVVVTDNQAVADYTEHRYGKRPVVIEYGADDVLEKVFLDARKDLPVDLFDKYAVAVSRGEPENNVELILEAFKNLPEHNLVYVSNWKHSRWSRELKEKYKDVPNIKMIGPIYDQRILNRIRSRASFYVHGHSVGGTNPSLVEAMWLGLPVIAYDVPFNRTVTENAAFYFKSTEELIEIIEGLTEEELAESSSKMLKIAKRKYSWDKILAQYERLFTSVKTASKNKKPVGHVSK